MNTSPTIEMMGYATSKPAFAGFPQSAQADLISPIAHDFNRGADMWTRYPCGVACGAGDLVEQQKPLEGGSWTTSALYLQGISLVRRNSEWHHFDPLGTAGVITNNSATVISNNLYDLFGVKRYEQGSAETPWRWDIERYEAEDMHYIGGGVFITTKGTSLTREGWRLPRLPWRIKLPPFWRGFIRGACFAMCIDMIGDLIDGWSECAEFAHSIPNRIACTICYALQNSPYSSPGCIGCLCGLAGPHWGIICGGGAFLLGRLCKQLYPLKKVIPVATPALPTKE